MKMKISNYKTIRTFLVLATFAPVACQSEELIDHSNVALSYFALNKPQNYFQYF